MGVLVVSVFALGVLFISANETGKPSSFESDLQTSRIVSVKPLNAENEFPKLVVFANGTRAIFKVATAKYPIHTSEVGAYRLDRLFGLNVVPATVFREVEGQIGSLQIFVENSETASARGMRNEDAPQEIRVLDFLTRNIDRHSENWIYVKGRKQAIAIDNDQSFGLFAMPELATLFPPPLEVELTEEQYRRFKQVSESDIQREMADIFPKAFEGKILDSINAARLQLIRKFECQRHLKVRN